MQTARQIVTIRKCSGLVNFEPIAPNSWNGQVNCLVGPFSCKEVAENFAYPKVDFGYYNTEVVQIFAKRDSWYVEIGNDSGRKGGNQVLS